MNIRMTRPKEIGTCPIWSRSLRIVFTQRPVSRFRRDLPKGIFPVGLPRDRVAENEAECSHRVRSFLAYMIDVWRCENVCDWRFLDNMPHLNRFQKLLEAKGSKITTIMKFLMQLQQFIKYLAKHRPLFMRLKNDRIVFIQDNVKNMLHEISQLAVKDKANVKMEKMARRVMPKDLRACLKLAARKIPELLGKTLGGGPRTL
ncbi:uncharacterized protein LOC133491698 [Syngnathoides biaculeatus]|uniref:uncharacterized protein LOC133491698 n=1 Tax=Syngnathoides biaculeatus TaxID=300417 RepID=UPI002ADDEE08|nr:uncharacterized protein LOC133491698 [Syngnathoides biaculeatus]